VVVLVRDVGSDTGKVYGVPNLAISMFFCYYRKDLFEERLSIRARIFGTFVGRNPPFRERARRLSCVRERSPTWLTLRRILFPLVPRRAEPKQGNIAGGVGTWGAGRAPKQPRRRPRHPSGRLIQPRHGGGSEGWDPAESRRGRRR